MTPELVELNRLYRGVEADSRELLSQIARAFMREQLQAQARRPAPPPTPSPVRPAAATNVIAFPRLATAALLH
jgi:hypothetical protein